MRLIIEPPDPGEPLPPAWRRFGWFAALALSSALATAGVAYLLKALLH